MPIPMLKHFLRFTLLVTTALPCVAQDKLHYYFVDFPPFHYQQPDELSPRGFTLDLLRLAALEAGERLHLQEVPLKRYIQLTQSGRLQVALVSQDYRKAFAEHYYCSRNALTELHPTLYVNSNRHPDLTSVQALTNHTVHTPKSTRFILSSVLPDTITLDTSYAIHLVGRGFNAGRISLLGDFDERLKNLLAEDPPPFPVHTIALAPIGISLCMNAQLERAAERQQALERAFLRIAHSAQGRALLRQYDLTLTFSPPPD